MNRFSYYKNDINDIQVYKRTKKLPQKIENQNNPSIKKRDKIRFLKKWNEFRKIQNKYFVNNKQIVFKEEINDFLIDFYNDPKTGYQGRDKLFSKIQNDYIGISRRDVLNFLNNLETNQVHKTPSIKPASRPIITRKPFVRYQIDLTFLKKKEKLNPILTMIDCFTKYAWCVILKNKEGDVVANALDNILKNEKNKPSTIQSDNGSEFKSNFYKNVLKKYKIKPIYSATYAAQQNGIIERFNGTIKRMIYKYMTHQGLTPNQFTQTMLNNLVSNYNNSKHSITGFAPISFYKNDDLHKIRIKATRQEIRDRATKIVKQNQKRFTPLQVNDFVRISKNTTAEFRKKTSLKKYSYEPQYFYEIYQIVSISKPTPTRDSQYTLALNNKKLVKKFIRKDLQKINKDQLIKNDSADNHYEIEKIVGKRVINGKIQYRVKWKNYDNRYNSYVDANDSFKEMIDKYERTIN